MKTTNGKRRETAEEWRRDIWALIQYFPILRNNPDALIVWDAQIGAWMADNITPDLIDYVNLFGEAINGDGQNELH